MHHNELTSEQREEIQGFAIEQARRSGANPDVMIHQLLDWTRRSGYGEFVRLKATQRALMAAHRGQAISPSQQVLVARSKEYFRTAQDAKQANDTVRRKNLRPLPAPDYTSWGDYLAKITWQELRRKCFDTAKRANRRRLVATPAKHQVSGLQVWHVMRNARGRCVHCGSFAVEGRPSNPNNGSPVAWEHVGRRIGSLDHANARSRGGDNEFPNLTWSCLLCNNQIAEQERAQGNSWRGKSNFGAIFSNLRGEPNCKKSDEIIAAKYESETGKRWSEREAFEGPAIVSS